MSLINKRTWRLAEIEKMILDRQATEATWPSQKRTAPVLDVEHILATSVMRELLDEVLKLDSQNEIDETEANPSTKATLDALSRIHRDLKIVAQAVAVHLVEKAPAENTGLPCPYCEQKMPRMDIKRIFLDGGEVLDIRISDRVDQKKLKAVISFLKNFVR